MSALAPKVASGVRALLAAERDAILERCTTCGRCFEVCPMTRYDAALARTPAREVAAGVLDILRDRPAGAAALAWVKLCTKSGECDAHCPESISPKMMMRLARIITTGGLGDAPQWPLKEDPDYFNKVHAFARDQLTPEEHAAWTVAPRTKP